jgi:hypothetical protein
LRSASTGRERDLEEIGSAQPRRWRREGTGGVHEGDPAGD